MEFHENQPIYMQIANLFCDNILIKAWKADEKIPSVRETAIKMEVNPNTAMRAYSFLQERDIIYNKRGIGYFVSPEGFNKTLSMIRDTFINEELPVVFKTMKLLGLTCSDMERLYENSSTENDTNPELY